MKKTFAVILTAFSLAACTVYNDKDSGTSSEVSINDYICYKCITPLNRVVELVDFFDRYRSLDDKEELDSLGNMIFGEVFLSDSISEERFVQEYWGEIVATEVQGQYLATISSNWTGTEDVYTVVTDGEGQYSIAYDSTNNTSSDEYEITTEAVVKSADEVFEVESLVIVYSDGDSEKPMEVTVNAGSGSEVLKIGLCREGTYIVYPLDGTLYYSITGYVTYRFKVLFYGDYFEIVDDEETVHASYNLS